MNMDTLIVAPGAEGVQILVPDWVFYFGPIDHIDRSSAKPANSVH